MLCKGPNREDTIEILQAVIRHHRKIAMLGLVGLLAASIWLLMMFLCPFKRHHKASPTSVFDKLLFSKKKLY